MPGDSKDLGVIRRCRDLVQLLYGLRMSAITAVQQLNTNANTSRRILTLDPRRVRLEIWIDNTDVATQVCQLGENQVDAEGDGQAISVLPGDTAYVERDFRSDLDAMTQELWFFATSANIIVSTRETLLTPLPVDET